MSLHVVLCNLGISDGPGDISHVLVLVANALISSRLDYCNSLLGVCLNSTSVSCNSFKIVLHARIVTNKEIFNFKRKFSRITLVLKNLPVESFTTFKRATLYFNTYLQLYSCGYSTRRSQNEGKYITVPRFQASVHKSAKHFTSSFAFDAPTLELTCR